MNQLGGGIMTAHVGHPLNGEVFTNPDALAADVAAELVAVAAAESEALREAHRLGDHRAKLEAWITATYPPDTRLSPRVVVVPGKPSRRMVDRGYCEVVREQLLDAGILRVERVESERTVYPTVPVVDSCRAELVARGVEVDRLVPPPVQGPPSVQIVEAGK